MSFWGVKIYSDPPTYFQGVKTPPNPHDLRPCYFLLIRMLLGVDCSTCRCVCSAQRTSQFHCDSIGRIIGTDDLAAAAIRYPAHTLRCHVVWRSL